MCVNVTVCAGWARATKILWPKYILMCLSARPVDRLDRHDLHRVQAPIGEGWPHGPRLRGPAGPDAQLDHQLRLQGRGAHAPGHHRHAHGGDGGRWTGLQGRSLAGARRALARLANPVRRRLGFGLTMTDCRRKIQRHLLTGRPHWGSHLGHWCGRSPTEGRTAGQVGSLEIASAFLHQSGNPSCRLSER